jgi:peptide/nickel transport system permease protein
MATYLAQRVLQTILILLGVAAITFLLLYMVPADPAVQIAGRSATAQTVANIRRELGLDQPLITQFLRYVGGLLQGDLGRSYAQKTDVMTLIASRLPATITLMIAGIAAELAIGVTLGVIAAVRRNSFLDRAVMIASFTTISAPQFLVALLLLYVFAATLGWFPMSGFGSLAHVVLPALTLGILGAGWYARIVRSTMIDVLNQDYVRTAKAKGVAPVRVVLRHALPNALLPVIAMIGIDIGQFMAGLVVVEAVFGWPGIGQLAVQSLDNLDRPVVMGTVLFGAAAVMLLNLAVDVARMYVDPRTRQEAA